MFDVSASVRSDRGCVRAVNEDSGLVVHPSDDELRRDKGVLLIVADGMGGHMAGDLASRMAVELVSGMYFDSRDAPADALRRAFHAANAGIHSHARREPRCRGMGTTCAALAIVNDTAVTANVGDSRIYLVREQALYLLTSDDSAVHDLVRRGLLTSEEARQHADRHVILSALGTRAELRVRHWAPPLPVRAGDRFLLCSDGLHDLVPDEELDAVMHAHPPEAACDALIALAIARGAPDNVTAIVADVTDPIAGTARRPVPPTREVFILDAPTRPDPPEKGEPRR
jgi:PPM family protein phosphatase